MSSLEKLKWPNMHCPQREQCMKSKTRWIVCTLRKEYICNQLIKEEIDKKNSKNEEKL